MRGSSLPSVLVDLHLANDYQSISSVTRPAIARSGDPSPPAAVGDQQEAAALRCSSPSRPRHGPARCPTTLPLH